jgi:hypothetical protein
VKDIRTSTSVIRLGNSPLMLGASAIAGLDLTKDTWRSVHGPLIPLWGGDGAHYRHYEGRVVS